MQAITEAEIVVGYKVYLNLITELLKGKQVINTGMTREVERCQLAIERARGGAKVALVSSGDPGVYGMAGLALELLFKEGLLGAVPVEIVPGITSATAAAALLGAPLMHDFVVISLSDLLTPWDVIASRLHLAAQGDFVVVLYNPTSRRRTQQIKTAQRILLEYKDSCTPVGIVRNASREGEEVIITTLSKMLEYPLDMFTTVIIGNSNSKQLGNYLVTLRGYRL